MPDFQRATAAHFPFSESLDFDHSPMLGNADELAAIVMRGMARAS